MRPETKRYDLREWAGMALETIENLKYGNRIDWFDLKVDMVRVPTLAERWIPKADIIVATWWANAYDVNRYGPDRGEKLYFIRHYETWGGPEDLVNRTYMFPLHRIVTSNWLKDLIERKFDVSTSGPVPNGVNLDLFYSERDATERHGPRRVGMLYRRFEWKGMKDGLEALLMARERHPDIQSVLFGQDPTREDMKIIEELGEVEFYRSPYKDKLREIYNSLDIFVFPSHSEGFGKPPMEAMACKCAVVTTDVGAIPDYAIPGRTALICPPKSPESLARSIIELVENEELRKRISEASYNHIVESFTWDRSIQALEEIFEKVLKEGRALSD